MIQSWLRIFRLTRAIFVASLKADLEYRMNFASRIVTDVFWYTAQIMIFEAIYRHTKVLGSWNHSQTRVFLGVLFVVDAIYMILFHDNLDRLPDRVRKGELDQLLAKPVPSQFMVSLSRMNTALIGNLMIGSSWLIWSLSQLENLAPFRLLWLVLLVPLGLMALYSVRFLITSLTVIFVKSDNLQYLWYQIYKLGMRPDQIYPSWLKYTLMTLLPVGLIASVPSRFVLEPPDFSLLALTVTVAVGFFFLTTKFWRFALKHYTSASS